MPKMQTLSRIFFTVLLTVFAYGLSNNIVSARFQFDSCDSYPNTPFTVFEIGPCRATEECFIDKGRDVQVSSWSFLPPSESHKLRLSVIIGSLDEDKGRYESEMLFDEPDLCQLEEFRNALSVREGNNPNHRQCHIPASILCQLPAYNFYVPRLLPTGMVNVTLQLRGDSDILACAKFEATLVE